MAINHFSSQPLNRGINVSGCACCEIMETKLNEAKKIRRNSKAALIRCGKKLASILKVKRPEGEVRDALNEVKEVYNN